MTSTTFFFALFVVVCQCQGLAVPPHQGSASPSGHSALVFPRNISHYYQGSWQLVNNSDPHKIGFKKNAGSTLFIMTNIELTNDVDEVHGGMVLRDGIYSTAYFLQGAYYWQTGALLLLANPLQRSNHRPAFQNLTFNPNTTFQQAYKDAEQIITEGVNVTIYEENECPFRLHFQLLPISALGQEIDKNSVSPIHVDTMTPSATTNTVGGVSAAASEYVQFEMAGLFVSPRCSTVMEIKAAALPLSHLQTKWKKYVIMVSVSSLLQILALIKQLEYNSNQRASSVSLITVGTQAVLDAYLCLIHLATGILLDSLFSVFVSAAFFQFITFSLFEMRYLLLIIKARNPQPFAEGWEALRREISHFYFKFYAVLVGGFAFVYYFSEYFNLFIIVLYSFWVPQIILNARSRARESLLWEYVIAMSVTRLAVPLYFFGCPYNVVLFEPNYRMATFLVFYVAAQVVVLYLQDKWSPRWFVPAMLLPKKYNYQRPLKANMTEDQRNCVICMCEVTLSERDHMITPCNHVFHGKCLRQWFEMKEECPTCRRTTPPLQE